MTWIRKHLRLASAFALCLFLSATVTPAAASGLVGSNDAANASFELVSEIPDNTLTTVAAISAVAAGVVLAYETGKVVGRVARAVVDAIGETEEPVIGTLAMADYDALDFAAFDG